MTAEMVRARRRSLALPGLVVLAGCSPDTATGGTRSVGAAGSAAAPAGQPSTVIASADTSKPATSSLPSTSAAASCAALSSRAMNERKPADIVIAVDNSGSMDEEIVLVREQLNAFSQQIVASGVDARIILLSAAVAAQPTMPSFFDDDDDDEDNGICIAAPLGSGRCPDDSLPPRYFHVPVEVSSHDALDRFIETYPRWQSQLRANAAKTFVVVTDDNAEDGPHSTPEAFTRAVANLPGFGTWSLSGIYCFSDCPQAAAIGTVYETLVQQTAGVKGDLCEQSFAPVFDRLAQAVVGASGLQCSWQIPQAPAGEAFDRKRVNVQYSAQGAAPRSVLQVTAATACGTTGGWYYDDANAPTRIEMCPSTCAQLQNDLQAQVEVLFGCETQRTPE